MRNSTIAFVAAVLVSAQGTPLLRAQSPPQSPPADARPLAFEVTSVKPNRSGEQGGSSRAQPGRYVGTNVTLKRVITLAYRPIQEFVGGPNWINTDRFDIEGTSEGTPNPQRMFQMLRALLAERFKLVVHSEIRELPAYALRVARRDGTLGARLRRSDVTCPAGPGNAPPTSPSPPPPDEASSCGFRLGDGALSGKGITMTQLAAELSITGRHVVDRSGLSGVFDVNLEWTPDNPGAGPAPPDSWPSIFTAVQEQLGLKLESTKAPIEVLVLDSAERPVPD